MKYSDPYGRYQITPHNKPMDTATPVINKQILIVTTQQTHNSQTDMKGNFYNNFEPIVMACYL